jgi:hypothetical protein
MRKGISPSKSIGIPIAVGVASWLALKALDGQSEVASLVAALLIAAFGTLLLTRMK